MNHTYELLRKSLEPRDTSLKSTHRKYNVQTPDFGPFSISKGRGVAQYWHCTIDLGHGICH